MKILNWITKASQTFYYGGALIVLGSLGITAAVYIDLVLLDIYILAEGPPIFSGLYVLRTCLIAIGCGLFIIWVAQVWILSR